MAGEGRCVKRVFIVSRQLTLDTLVLGPYMNAHNLKDVRTLYRSFCRVRGSKVLCVAFKAHVLVRNFLILCCCLYMTTATDHGSKYCQRFRA
jgi:hypothetical protein